MQLINVSKTAGIYTVKAMRIYKILGLQVWSRTKIFEYSETTNEWKDLEADKIASPDKAQKLNKWLKDHQKFIEKF